MTQREKNPLYLSKRINRPRSVGGSCSFSGSRFVILIFVLFFFIQKSMCSMQKNLET